MKRDPFARLYALDRAEHVIALCLLACPLVALLIAYEYYPALSPPHYVEGTVLTAGPINTGSTPCGIRENATVQTSDGAVVYAKVDCVPGYTARLPGGPLRKGDSVTVREQKDLIGLPSITVVSRH